MSPSSPGGMSRRAVLAGLLAGAAGCAALPLAALGLFDDDEQPGWPAAGAVDDIPAGLPAVYLAAAHACPGLPWTVLAAIGHVESRHDPTAIGPPLDGRPGVRAIPATEQGTAWHGDAVWERAVGMMQFLPATFAAYGVSARGGRPDPFDPADAAASAAVYLCANGAPARLEQALFAYNRAAWYVEEVLAKAAAYAAAAPLPAAGGGVGVLDPDYVAVARTRLGAPYRWGAAGPDAFDCSGLVLWALHRVGVAIPRTSAAQAAHVAAHGLRISPDAAAGTYGALLFRIGVGAVNHVAISLGDGRTLEAWRRGQPVQTRTAAGRTWTAGGLVPGVAYQPASEAA
jgi:cell wall-associated NlpC family hydrolase